MRRALITALLLQTVLSAQAKDFGVQGTLWEILEPDIRIALMESAARANWEKAKEETVASSKKFLENLPKFSIPIASKSETTWMDPSIEIGSDIQAPLKQPDGKYAWSALAKKGTKFNPLTQLRPVTAMLFFNGDDPAQVALVKEAMSQADNAVVPVESGSGLLSDVSKSLSRPVYKATEQHLAKFNVRALPSLIFAGAGQHSLHIGTRALAPPYSTADLFADWLPPSRIKQGQPSAPVGSKTPEK